MEEMKGKKLNYCCGNHLDRGDEWEKLRYCRGNPLHRVDEGENAG